MTNRSEALTLSSTFRAGSVMADGSVCAGISPDTGRPMFTTPNDAPPAPVYYEAAKYARRLDAHGHRDWRMPTKAELSVLFQNRAEIGNFDTTGSLPAGWYWSSSRHYFLIACAQRFSDGLKNAFFSKYHASSLRCVRG